MNNNNDRIFLCHASEDKHVVADVYHKLRSVGLNPWLDKMDLLPGQSWKQEIPRALKKSRFIIIFFSSTSVLKRGYVQREFKLALDTLQEIPEDQIFIIPVRLDDCGIPESFLHLHHVDLMEDGGFDKILKSLYLGFDKGLNQIENYSHSNSIKVKNQKSSTSTKLKIPDTIEIKKVIQDNLIQSLEKVLKNDEYYAAPAQLPHQKGKWAVFHNGAQLQGTLSNTEDEARANAKGMNQVK